MDFISYLVTLMILWHPQVFVVEIKWSDMRVKFIKISGQLETKNLNRCPRSSREKHLYIQHLSSDSFEKRENNLWSWVSHGKLKLVLVIKKVEIIIVLNFTKFVSVNTSIHFHSWHFVCNNTALSKL